MLVATVTSHNQPLATILDVAGGFVGPCVHPPRSGRTKIICCQKSSILSPIVNFVLSVAHVPVSQSRSNTAKMPKEVADIKKVRIFY